MPDGTALPRVIKNELLHFGQTHSEPANEAKCSGLLPPGPQSRESVQVVEVELK